MSGPLRQDVRSGDRCHPGLGDLLPIPQDAIDRLYDRYQNVYGQADDPRRVIPAPDASAQEEVYA